MQPSSSLTGNAETLQTITVYNKLFTKILDSSIWLESDHTRIVWLTLLAAMDEEGHAQFASVANLAHRAIVPLEAAEKAVKRLEDADPNSSDPDNEGRRIERIQGGWIVLNAHKYREIVTRAIAQERNRARVAKFRAKTNSCNGDVMPSNGLVTPSEALAETESVSDTDGGRAKAQPDDEWIESLKQDEAYKGIDVAREVSKCSRWCETNRKALSRRRIVNWLNRAEKPMSASPQLSVVNRAPITPPIR